MLAWYSACLKSRPFATNVVSSALIFTAGDIGAQAVERSQWSPFAAVLTSSSSSSSSSSSLLESVDLRRTRQQVVWASCFYTPFFFGLYGFFNRQWPGPATARTTFYRVFLSFLSAPFVNAAFFTYGAAVAVLEQTVDDHGAEDSGSQGGVLLLERVRVLLSIAERKIRDDLLNTWKASATLWIPVNVVNFYFVPPHLTIIFTNCFSVLWSFYLSLVQFKKQTPEELLSIPPPRDEEEV